MDRLLSGEDLRRALGGECLIMEYKDLARGPQDIMEILRRAHGRLILLYESEPQLGHWCSVVLGTGRQKGRIFYTDPYGKPIDHPLDEMPGSWRASSGQDVSMLAHLLSRAPAGTEIWFNEFPLQGDDENIATCGRWALMRCLLPHLSEREFAELFERCGDASPDEIVTLASRPWLGF